MYVSKRRATQYISPREYVFNYQNKSLNDKGKYHKIRKADRNFLANKGMIKW